ncbi:MAG: hypothetical protein F6K10_36005 [Moorea sp. SIO2B7]|nr:hypothetical protein [Moorena sp. SIO2B7]
MIYPATLTTFLAPFLPFLLEVGNKATDSAAQEFGADAWKKAKAIWTKLRPKVEAKEAAKEAVDDVAATPDDEDSRTVLRMQLKKLLQKDQALAEAIAEIMQENKATEASTVTNIQENGDIKQEAGDNAKQFGPMGKIEYTGSGSINF